MVKKRILLVEDELEMVRAMQIRLEQAGYEVLSTGDGKEALDKAKKESPDLVILDLMLPKMDGYKVCGLLKADARYNRIPVIMATARAQESDEKLGFEVGADAYITKPFQYEILLAKIKELLKE
ncbi:MAG: response regulator [Candidatus Omnitrophota bacterium]|jgi:DNA-binding response OmpR family regulator